jgi:hypothetical protein
MRFAVDTKSIRFAVDTRFVSAALLRYPTVPKPTTVEVRFSLVIAPIILVAWIEETYSCCALIVTAYSMPTFICCVLKLVAITSPILKNALFEPR